jgi:hypothetical protein
MRLRRSELNQSRWRSDFSFSRHSSILLLYDGDRVLLDLLVVVDGATLVRNISLVEAVRRRVKLV